MISFISGNPKKSRKDKNVQIGPLTQESLQINRDEYGDNNGNNLSPKNPFLLPQYTTMREIHENSPKSRQSSGGDSSRKSKKSKDKSKRGKKPKSKSKKYDRDRDRKRGNKGKDGGKKRKGSKAKSHRTNPGSEGNEYQYNVISIIHPPSQKTGASSVTTNDDNKTFITHSSHYTHSSQRSHQPYTYYNPTRDNRHHHHRHHTASYNPYNR